MVNATRQAFFKDTTISGTLTVSGKASFAADVTMAQDLNIFGILTAETRYVTKESTLAQITADQNNFNPFETANLRLFTDASRTITGFQAGTDGRHLYITNVGSFDLVLSHEDTASTATNRIRVSNGSNLTLTPDDRVPLIYDDTSSRWRVQVREAVEIVIPSQVTTTNATITTLATIALADNTAYYISARIQARRTDAAGRAIYRREVAAYREAAGAAALQGTVGTPFTRESSGLWEATFDVDGGNNVRIRVTGEAAQTINWGGSYTIEKQV